MLNILIVDDSLMFRQKLSDILIKLGHNIVGTAKDGIEAISLTKKLKPDFITMDIVMPNMGGIEAIRKIKEYDKNSVIIVMSANGREEDILDSFKEGAIGFILKPFTIDKLKQEIGNIFPEYHAEADADILYDTKDCNL